MKSVLISFFNSRNIGDISLSNMLKEMLEKYGTVETLSFSGNAILEEGKEDFGQGSHIKRNLYVFFRKAKLDWVVKLYRRIKGTDKEIEDIIKDCDCVIIGGGNMLFDTDVFSVSALHFKMFVDIAKKYKKPVFAISIGIGPFRLQTQLEAAIEQLERCDSITFRDRYSYELFCMNQEKMKNNVYLSIDPVFTKKIIEEEKVDYAIGVCIITDEIFKEYNKRDNWLEKGYVELIETLKSNFNNKIVIFSTDKSDYKMINKLREYFIGNQQIEIIDANSIEDIEKLYRRIGILIGTRMHSMILAYDHLIPVIGLAWQEKVWSMFEQMDMKNDVYNLVNLNTCIPHIIESIEEKMEDYDFNRRQIKSKLKQLSQRNEINFEILDKLEQEVKCEAMSRK